VSGENPADGIPGAFRTVEKLRQLFEAFSAQREILDLLDRSIGRRRRANLYSARSPGYRILDDCSVVIGPPTGSTK